mmetsp:Transcript_12127/g.29272  ORF Transcript_12127/g.29272 Transcript_12127/m.29272 type:complete len:1100 (+) Transcript_12127:190-3489(+)
MNSNSHSNHLSTIKNLHHRHHPVVVGDRGSDRVVVLVVDRKRRRLEASSSSSSIIDGGERDGQYLQETNSFHNSSSETSLSSQPRHRCRRSTPPLPLQLSSEGERFANTNNKLIINTTDKETDLTRRLSKRRRLSSRTRRKNFLLATSTAAIMFLAQILFVSVRRNTNNPTMFRVRAFTSSNGLYRWRQPSAAATTTSSRLDAMDSRQLRFLGDYSKRDEEEQEKAAAAAAAAASSTFPFSSSIDSNSSISKQRMYSAFIEEYVSGNSFWSSVMSGSMTNQGILSQALRAGSFTTSTSAAVSAASGGATGTTVRQEITKETVIAAGISSPSQKIWKRQVSSTTRTTTPSKRFVSSLSSSNEQVGDGGSTGSSSSQRKAADKLNALKKNLAESMVRPVDDDYPFEPRRGYGPYVHLSSEERQLFQILRKAREEMGLTTTLRVAGGWVRDKLLATPEFARSRTTASGYYESSSPPGPAAGGIQRLTSKYKQPSTAAASMGRQGGKVIGDSNNNRNKNSKNTKNGKSTNAGSDESSFECQPPVDIDIALDDMLGREYAEHLNDYLGKIGEKTHSVGVILQNPEKSKHLETATMKVGTFWIDFVNLRAEEYTQDSRIPDLMRIGSPAEDAFRRDLTINSLFYNVNNGQIEDWTGRGFDDLRRGVVSTPLAPLTTLLDDPLRALRSVRFAARLRFMLDDSLIDAAMDDRVREALAEKVSRERIGCEVDLMLRSPDPVGAMRLLIRLNLAQTVFPFEKLLLKEMEKTELKADAIQCDELYQRGVDLLRTNYEHLEECKIFPPVWCQSKGGPGYSTATQMPDMTLCEDDETRRYLWYASFLKPLYNFVSQIPEELKSKRQGKKANRSVVSKLLVDELKRPTREAESVEKIIKGAQEFKKLMNSGYDLSAVSVLLSDIHVKHVHAQSENSIADSDLDGDYDDDEVTKKIICKMNDEKVYCATATDPVWQHAMSFRLKCSKVLRKVGPLWRAALFLAMSEHITDSLEGQLEYVIEGDVFDETQEDARQAEVDRYNAFATAMQRLGLIGVWDERPILDGGEVKKVLPQIPKGPAFREVMDEQEEWTTIHPSAGTEVLAKHLQQKFREYT